ncbi:MAG TPA: dodecin family protein [Desulfomonilia bacterium]|nr:dodecin family protein [Desulfomonilia bacterium]
MAETEYHVIELIGTSPESWEKAAAKAIETASETLRDTRIAEVIQLDMHTDDKKQVLYRAKLRVSFKYHMIFSLTPKFHNHSHHW